MMDINSDGLEAEYPMLFNRILALASIPRYGMVRAAQTDRMMKERAEV
jgi:hypothetical protein